MPYLRHYTTCCLEGMGRARDTFQFSLCPGLDSNAAPPEYESECVTITPTLSIKCCVANNNRHMPDWTSQCERCFLVLIFSVPLLFPFHRVYAEV
jgi:hypothetical protein